LDRGERCRRPLLLDGEKARQVESEADRKGRMSIEETASRFFENLIGRLHGPLKFRLVLQPLMAVFVAIRDGRKDANEGRVGYFWALFTEPGQRRDLLRNGWQSVGKVFIIAMILDAVYQFIVVRWFYPGEALVVAVVLAIVPYVLLRGPASRLTSRMR